MSHTKEKVKVGLFGLETPDWDRRTIFDEQDNFFADTETSTKTYEEECANARRLVACWNALDGVPTEWLENYVGAGLKNVIQQNSDLIRKEEELTERLIATEEENAALKAVIEQSTERTLNDQNVELKSENEKLREAIQNFLDTCEATNPLINGPTFVAIDALHAVMEGK